MSGRPRARIVALTRAAVALLRRHESLLRVAPLAVAVACSTQTISTTRTPVAAGMTGTNAITPHGYIDGELVVQFTQEGERAVAPAVGQQAAPLRFGVASLDRLN